MRKLAILTSALLFTGANLSIALGAGPAVTTTGQALRSGLESNTVLVRNDEKSKKIKKSSKNKKSPRKSSEDSSKPSSGGGMNMPNMPPGHKM